MIAPKSWLEVGVWECIADEHHAVAIVATPDGKQSHPLRTEDELRSAHARLVMLAPSRVRYAFKDAMTNAHKEHVKAAHEALVFRLYPYGK